MASNKKIFAYSNNTNYIVCLCEISDFALNKFRNYMETANYYNLLHKFDNMLASTDGIINLGVLSDDLVEDISNVSKVTTQFLNILEIKEEKMSSLEEFSQGWRCAQCGVFGTNIKNNKCLKEYISSINNNGVMDIIGYDLKSKSNKKSKNL